jgi:hypothetical protein
MQEFQMDRHSEHLIVFQAIVGIPLFPAIWVPMVFITTKIHIQLFHLTRIKEELPAMLSIIISQLLWVRKQLVANGCK